MKKLLLTLIALFTIVAMTSCDNGKKEESKEVKAIETETTREIEDLKEKKRQLKQ